VEAAFLVGPGILGKPLQPRKPPTVVATDPTDEKGETNGGSAFTGAFEGRREVCASNALPVRKTGYLLELMSLALKGGVLVRLPRFFSGLRIPRSHSLRSRSC
jgi:hypothetical protein